ERRVLGGTGFHLGKRPISKRSAEIGMWIRSSSAGLGLGTRVLREMLAWGFTQWPWMRLSWRASETNLASRRTAEKAGMPQEGIFQCDDYDAEGNRCSTVVYGLTREQWMSSDDGVREIETKSLGD
ncbi:MAG: GNAT family protein, partial [Myxococcota bacterium]